MDKQIVCETHLGRYLIIATLGFFVQKMCMPTSIYGSVATTTLRCGQDGTEKDEDRPDHLFEHVRSETPSSVYINNMT